MIPKVYCDMDGVLADFSKAFHAAMDIDTRNGWVTITYEWKQLQKKWPTFWMDLEFMPNGKSLWQSIAKYRPSLLTAYPESWPGASTGKHIWAKRMLPKFGYHPQQQFIACLRHEKRQYAKQSDGTPNVLIDDMLKNIEEWRSAGGIGIHYIDSASSVRKVAAVLDKLIGKG